EHRTQTPAIKILGHDGSVGYDDVNASACLFKGLREIISRHRSSRKQHIQTVKPFASTDVVRQCRENPFSFELLRHDVDVNVRVAKPVGRCYTYCARL